MAKARTTKAKTPEANDDAPAGGMTAARKVAALNRWREQYNPLRGLKLVRAISLLEQFPRGEMADLQWTYFFVEQTDPDLFALIDRRTSKLREMDWDAKIVTNSEDAPRADFDEGLANEQRAALFEAYNRIENFYDLVDHLALATFRGFAHAEKIRTVAGDTLRFEIVDQWNMVRDGLVGDWKYNPEAQATTFAGLPPENLVLREDFVIRELPRHVNRIALIKFIRGNLSEKDWDAFVEMYGFNGTIIIGPPNVPKEREAEYQAAAQQIAESNSGYLPNMSDVKFANAERGTSPFRERSDYLTEKLILAGTNGLLTMLARSGTGTLAGDAHEETFNILAKGEARKISELLQKQIDKPLLAKTFPGRPVLAYFALAQNEETDAAKVVEDVQKLGLAGYDVDAAQIEELSGYRVTLRPGPAQMSGAGGQLSAKQAEAAVAKNVRHLFNTDEELKAFLNSSEGRNMVAARIANRGTALDRLVEEFPNADRNDLISVLANKKKDDPPSPGSSGATDKKKVMEAASPQFKAAHVRETQPIREALAIVLNASDEAAPAMFRNLRAGLPDLHRIVARKPETAPVLADTMTASLFNGIDDAAKERKAAA